MPIEPSGAPLSPQFRIVRSYPHDPSAFTQGLHFFDGKLYESTGLLGRSSIRRVDLKSGVVEHQTSLPPDHFGEGIAQVGDWLFQLTWQNQKALVWDLASLKKVREFPYEGEGWGLCFDGTRLVMSDGSDTLTFRHPSTFVILGKLAVQRNRTPLFHLNELECTGGVIFANVWQDEHIAIIDPHSGKVTQWIDFHPLRKAMALLAPQETAKADVLNGIAFLPTTGHLLLTGKYWPRLFEVAIIRSTNP